jgi:hypothetical protein
MESTEHLAIDIDVLSPVPSPRNEPSDGDESLSPVSSKSSKREEASQRKFLNKKFRFEQFLCKKKNILSYPNLSFSL